ncbi:MAG: hypothetical protein J5881_02270 [Clostridia bacterium]|nr:hypothetical protein [Clostridia bacterium]
MKVKVYIDENNDICREDNGEVIGHKALCIGNSFWTNEGILSDLQYGYFVSDNIFCELCDLTSCSHECLAKQKPNCRYVLKGDKSEGFYYFYEE